MKLVPKAGKIAWQSYSMWGQYLSLMTLLVPAVLYGVWGVDTNPYLWGKLAILFGAFGIIGRVVDQRIAEEGGKWRLPKLPMLMLMALILILVLGGMTNLPAQKCDPMTWWNNAGQQVIIGVPPC